MTNEGQPFSKEILSELYGNGSQNTPHPEGDLDESKTGENGSDGNIDRESIAEATEVIETFPEISAEELREINDPKLNVDNFHENPRLYELFQKLGIEKPAGSTGPQTVKVKVEDRVVEICINKNDFGTVFTTETDLDKERREAQEARRQRKLIAAGKATRVIPRPERKQ